MRLSPPILAALLLAPAWASQPIPEEYGYGDAPPAADVPAPSYSNTSSDGSSASGLSAWLSQYGAGGYSGGSQSNGQVAHGSSGAAASDALASLYQSLLQQSSGYSSSGSALSSGSPLGNASSGSASSSNASSSGASSSNSSSNGSSNSSGANNINATQTAASASTQSVLVVPLPAPQAVTTTATVVASPVVQRQVVLAPLPAEAPRPPACSGCGCISTKLAVTAARRVRLQRSLYARLLQADLNHAQKPPCCGAALLGLHRTAEGYTALASAAGAVFAASLDADSMLERPQPCGRPSSLLVAQDGTDAQLLADDAGSAHVIVWRNGSPTVHSLDGLQPPVSLNLPREAQSGRWSPLAVGGSVLLLRVLPGGVLAAVRCALSCGTCMAPVYSRPGSASAATNLVVDSSLLLEGGTPFHRVPGTHVYAMVGHAAPGDAPLGRVSLARPALTLVEVHAADAAGRPRVRLLHHGLASVDDSASPLAALWRASPAGPSERLVPVSVASWPGINDAPDAQAEVVYAAGSGDAVVMRLSGVAGLVQRVLSRQ